MDFLKKELAKRVADVDCFKEHEGMVANHREEIAKHEAEIAKHEDAMKAFDMATLAAEINEIMSIIDALEAGKCTECEVEAVEETKPVEILETAVEAEPVEMDAEKTVEKTVSHDAFSFSSMLVG